MADSDNGKKKSFLLRIFKTAAATFVLFFVTGSFLYADSVEYISRQEQMMASREADMLIDDLLDLLFDWYGLLPDDDDDDWYFMDDDYYDGYDCDNYDPDDFYGYDDWDWDDYDCDDEGWAGYDWDDLIDDVFDDIFDWDDDDEYAYDDDDDDDYYAYDDDDDDDWGGHDSGRRPNKPDGKEKKDDKKPQPNINVPGSEKRKKFLAQANGFMGTPYVYGGASHSGVDCSGLVYCAAKEAGIGTLPRSSRSLYNMAKRIDRNAAKAGDLIFFATGSSISHVAIYVGNNQILHAVSDGPRTGVMVSKLTENYWKNHYYASGRIFDD